MLHNQNIDMRFLGEKLKSARIMAGMSLQDLANKVTDGFSKQAIHKFETGELIPNNSTIEDLVKILGKPRNFFYHPFEAELGLVEFRKIHSKMSAKDHAMLREITRDFASRYLELEKILGVFQEFKNPLERFAINCPDDIEKAAQHLRHSWELGYGPLASIIELLEDRGIMILEIEIGDGFDGLQTKETFSNAPVLVLNKSHFKSSDRKRFTILHELGHLLLKLDEYPEKERERFCNAFAGAMLLPEKAIIDEFGSKRTSVSFQELGAIKLKYGISIQAIAYRLREKGVVTENYFKQFMFMVTQLGYRVNEPYSYNSNEQALRFNQFVYRAVSEKIISIEKGAELKNITVETFLKERL